jgi:predicted enzyme related to lactoylglutathione lyase
MEAGTMNKQYAPNGIGHFDIGGPDAAALGSFYAGMFGWQVASRGPGYALVSTPAGGPDGAIAEAEAPGITIGVVVPDLDRSVDEASRLGGAVVMPVVDNGWVKKARISDPAGNILTLIQG